MPSFPFPFPFSFPSRNPLSLPYPTHPYTSAYGPPTGNTNFCERDHEFTPHIAELINTLTNLVYVVYALHGLRLLSHRRSLTFSAALPHLGLVCVGLGSAAFHATLLKVPQLLDEIGMAVPTGAVLSRLLSFRVRDPRTRKLVYVASLAAVAAVYVLHCFTFSNWIHYPVFGAMVHYIGRRSAWLTRRIRDEGVRRKVQRQARTGRVLFLGAFALWLVDRFFCERLCAARDWLGLPWGWVLELHGWWHVGTGMGAFVFIQVAEFLMEGEQSDPGARLSPFTLRVGPTEGDTQKKSQ